MRKPCLLGGNRRCSHRSRHPSWTPPQQRCSSKFEVSKSHGKRSSRSLLTTGPNAAQRRSRLTLRSLNLTHRSIHRSFRGGYCEHAAPRTQVPSSERSAFFSLFIDRLGSPLARERTRDKISVVPIWSVAGVTVVRVVLCVTIPRFELVTDLVISNRWSCERLDVGLRDQVFVRSLRENKNQNQDREQNRPMEASKLKSKARCVVILGIVSETSTMTRGTFGGR